MPATFDHGFALLIGVGACDYAKWSLPATVKDMSALRAALTDPHLCAYPADDQHFRLLHDDGATGPASTQAAWSVEQTPFLDAATEDFAVALLLGGKGLSGQPAGADRQPSAGGATYTANVTGDGAVAQDHSVAAGAGGIAIGGNNYGQVSTGDHVNQVQTGRRKSPGR